MAATRGFALTLEDDLRVRLERLAVRVKRDPAELMRDAVQRYLDQEGYDDAVARGRAAAAAGRSVDGDAVEAWLESWGRDDEGAPPSCG